MGSSRKKRSKRKRKQSGTPSTENPTKMADNTNSNSKQTQETYFSPQQNQSPNISTVYSAAHNTIHRLPIYTSAAIRS